MPELNAAHPRRDEGDGAATTAVSSVVEKNQVGVRADTERTFRSLHPEELRRVERRGGERGVEGAVRHRDEIVHAAYHPAAAASNGLCPKDERSPAAHLDRVLVHIWKGTRFAVTKTDERA